VGRDCEAALALADAPGLCEAAFAPCAE